MRYGVHSKEKGCTMLIQLTANKLIYIIKSVYYVTHKLYTDKNISPDSSPINWSCVGTRRKPAKLSRLCDKCNPNLKVFKKAGNSTLKQSCFINISTPTYYYLGDSRYTT